MEEDKKDYQSDLEILQTVRLTIQWREKDAFLYLKIKNSLCETLYTESDAKKLILGNCSDFDKHCGSSLTTTMCSSHPELMEKNCPKLCNMCSKYELRAINNLSFCLAHSFQVQIKLKNKGLKVRQLKRT